ncbi:TonB-dependent receptor domain-containing protein [Pseudomaricurvus alkylphenolicus]|uniref:TonB-dependent receptor domain-containing protein n=1 Tax=Pseudomaricurvus alkylphenolicus TaxID=1306991 RepID=UPI001423C2AD
MTATKRGAAAIQDIPFSVQALGGSKLDSMGASDFGDFFRMVPGLATFDQGPGDKRYIIRGVNSTGGGTVGLYLDEVIITGENAQDGGGRQPDIKLFDIDRVEVLKGPQGTTFGSSSLSGTIRYITNKPNVYESELEATVSLRDTDSADFGHELEVIGNLPLVEGKLALRAAGYHLEKGGFIDNNFDDGVNNDSTVAARVSLAYQPTDELSLYLMATTQDTETNGGAYFNEVNYNGEPLPKNEQADASRNPFEDDMKIYNATLNYSTASGTITATASKLERDSVLNRDSSLALDRFLGLPFDGEGRSTITQPKYRELESYEVRFSSDWDSRVQVLAGVFMQDEERYFRSAILSAEMGGRVSGNPTAYLDRNVETSVEEVAVFTEVSMDITGSLNITAGLRWFDFEINEVGTSVTGFGGGDGAGVGPALAFGESDIIGKFNISYQLNEDVLTYFQWAEGYRAGGANDQTAAAIANVNIPAGFGSDSLENFELGIKTTLAEGKVVANAAFYYIDWSDIQLQDQATSGSVSFPFRGNGGAAEIKGMEFDLTAYPIDGLEMIASANFTNAELVEDNPIASSGMGGDDIPYTPEMTLSLSADYEWVVSSDNMTAFVGADVMYVDERSTEFRPDNSLNVELDSYSLTNMRGGIKGEGWSVSLSVNNVFDDNTVTDVYRIIPGVYPNGFIPNQPRSAILSFNKKFF